MGAFAGIARIRRELDGLAREGLLRERRMLDSPQGPGVREAGATLANFASNDYLGLANDPRVIAAARDALGKYGFGAGASPLVVGHARAHEEAERAFADFSGQPRALLFSSGYTANLGIVAALADRESAVFADRLDHACLVDGALLSRAEFHRYPHGDLRALERRLAASKARTRLIATDAVFSMDGDVAPLPELLALAERFDAWLVVDDAHGIGVLGRGRGTLAHFGIASDRIVYMATLGKALGGYGAFVTGAPDVVEWLLQRARTYVFSTALPPAAAAAATAALAIVAAEPERLARLHANVASFREGLASAGVACVSPTAIQPVVLGDPVRAVSVSARLRERGHLVPAIRPPTVPAGTSRLRVSLSSEHSPAQVTSLVRDLADALAA